MSLRITCAMLLALSAAPAMVPATARAAEPLERISMTGRWYEHARLPNKMQAGCVAGASDWTPAGDGFQVLQTCRKGAPDGPVAQWKARATLDQAGGAVKISYFGGLVTQEYKVLDHSPEGGWLILAAKDGKYLWLFSQRPKLPDGVRGEALRRIRQLGIDPGRLEFPGD